MRVYHFHVERKAERRLVAERREVLFPLNLVAAGVSVRLIAKLLPIIMKCVMGPHALDSTV